MLPRVEVYGQHEISELTNSREKLTRLLDRFVGREEASLRRKTDLRRELEKNRRSLVEARAEISQIEERLAALPGLEETLQRFREAGLEDRLKEQSLIVREERVLASIPERLASFRECLGILKRDVPVDRMFLSDKALEELPGREILARANDAFAQLDRDLKRAREEIEQALERADERIAVVRAEWETRKTEVQAAYEKILRELQKSRVDGEEFIRLRRQIEELRPLRERQTLMRRLEKEHADRRRALLAEWEDIKAEEFRRLDRAAKKVGKKLRDRVQVEVTAGGDREPLYRVLRDEIAGRLSEAIDCLRDAPDLSLTRFVEAGRAGAGALANEYKIPPAQADRIAGAAPEVLMRIEELELATSAWHQSTWDQ